MKQILLLLVGIAIGAVGMRELDRRLPDFPVAGVAHLERGARQADEDDDDDDDDGSVPAGAEYVLGTGQVTLTDAEVALAGLEFGALTAAQTTPESATTGRVADVAELLAQVSDLRAARATATAARAVVTTQEARLARLRGLEAAGKIAIARELAALEIEHRRELATLISHETRIENLASALRARWGNALAELERSEAPSFGAIARGESLVIEFAADAQPPARVWIATGETRADAVPAEVTGPGTTAYGAGGRASWQALAPATGLRIGMPVRVWVPRTSDAVNGAVLPAEAVVWHRGAPWYYVAETATRFRRRAVGDALPYGHDYLLPAPRVPKMPVVVHGAQALLAVEFHAAIPDDDDD